MANCKRGFKFYERGGGRLEDYSILSLLIKKKKKHFKNKKN
jgi:hypothetical protein